MIQRSIGLEEHDASPWFVGSMLQDPRTEVIPSRGLFTQMIGLRLKDLSETAMVLGEVALMAVRSATGSVARHLAWGSSCPRTVDLRSACEPDSCPTRSSGNCRSRTRHLYDCLLLSRLSNPMATCHAHDARTSVVSRDHPSPSVQRGAPRPRRGEPGLHPSRGPRGHGHRDGEDPPRAHAVRRSTRLEVPALRSAASDPANAAVSRGMAPGGRVVDRTERRSRVRARGA